MMMQWIYVVVSVDNGTPCIDLFTTHELGQQHFDSIEWYDTKRFYKQKPDTNECECLEYYPTH